MQHLHCLALILVTRAFAVVRYAPARLQKVADAAVALADALAALKTDDEAQKESDALYREAVRINRLVTPRSRP